MKRKAKKGDIVIFEIDDEPLHLGIVTSRDSAYYNDLYVEVSFKYIGRECLILRSNYHLYEQFPEDFIDRNYVHLKLQIPWLADLKLQTPWL